MGKLVLILLIAHLIADYPMQANNMKRTINGLFLHIGIHFFVGFICAVTYLLYYDKSLIDFLLVMFCLININFIHLLVDYFKENLSNKIKNKYKAYTEAILNSILYVVDQLIHAATIIYTVQVIYKEKYHVFDKFISLITYEKDFNLEVSTQILLTIIIVLLNIFFVGYLIGILLIPFKPENLVREMVMEVPFENTQVGNISHEHFVSYDLNNILDKKVTEIKKITAQEKVTFIKDSPAKAGMWIGILERTLILILCVLNNISSIGFIIAMKALTRFKQFDDKSFAEYYLIGSMLSISFAIINGYLIRIIW